MIIRVIIDVVAGNLCIKQHYSPITNYKIPETMDKGIYRTKFAWLSYNTTEKCGTEQACTVQEIYTIPSMLSQEHNIYTFFRHCSMACSPRAHARTQPIPALRKDRQWSAAGPLPLTARTHTSHPWWPYSRGGNDYIHRQQEYNRMTDTKHLTRAKSCINYRQAFQGLATWQLPRTTKHP